MITAPHTMMVQLRNLAMGSLWAKYVARITTKWSASNMVHQQHRNILTASQAPPIEDECRIRVSLKIQNGFMCLWINTFDLIQVQVLDDAKLGGCVQNDLVDILKHEGKKEKRQDAKIDLSENTSLLCGRECDFCGRRHELEGNVIFVCDFGEFFLLNGLYLLLLRP